ISVYTSPVRGQKRSGPARQPAGGDAAVLRLVAPAAPSVTAAPAGAAAPTAPVFPGLGLVDRQPAAVHLLVAEPLDGRLGLLVAAHLDEAEALGAAGVPVHDDLGRLHRAELPEQLLQRAVGRAVGEVADVQLLAHGGPPGKGTWHATAPAGRVRTRNRLLYGAGGGWVEGPGRPGDRRGGQGKGALYWPAGEEGRGKAGRGAGGSVVLLSPCG